MLRNPTTEEINKILSNKLERRLVPCEKQLQTITIFIKSRHSFSIVDMDIGSVLFYDFTRYYNKYVEDTLCKIIFEPEKLYHKKCNAILEIMVLDDTEIYLLNLIKLG